MGDFNFEKFKLLEERRFYSSYGYCKRSVQMRSYFWFVFSCIPTEYGDLRSKSPYGNSNLKGSNLGQNKCDTIALSVPKKWSFYVHIPRNSNFRAFYFLFFTLMFFLLCASKRYFFAWTISQWNSDFVSLWAWVSLKKSFQA